jgi:hypothetical protein
MDTSLRDLDDLFPDRFLKGRRDLDAEGVQRLLVYL